MELEPPVSERLGQLFASVVQIVANVNRKRGSRVHRLEEALLTFGDEKRPGGTRRDWKLMKAVAQALTESQEGPAQAVVRVLKEKRGV